ncbi:DUF2069 domain-containing protein [Ectothiorhodospira mobilis]|uniref:DUF2069 domain-containing protein n=1 Tax=Ectothiorhodospira mobilis TaxID=195064 RepID=UPI0019035A54|nr:DUF2069 domain-containing protein [Ectothiorhodospira mobilis]MBK1692724.1 hypothetical protein [Ectothiorhodospira mobilis]
MTRSGSMRLFRVLTLGGILGLLALILLQTLWLSPPERLPRSLVLAVLALPLLPPLRGLLHGRPRTHIATGLLTLPYFLLGAWLAVSPALQGYGLLMAGLSLLLFTGCLGYARLALHTGQPATDAEGPTGGISPGDGGRRAR